MKIKFAVAAALTIAAQQSLAANAMRTIKVLPGNCSAINEAVANLPEAGGRIQLLEGTYNCDEPIVIHRNDVSLIGSGREKTILKLSHGKALPAVVIGVLEVAAEQTVNHGIQFYPVREIENVLLQGFSVLGDFNGSDRPDAARECYDVAQKKSLSCDNDGGRLVRNNGITIRRSNKVVVRDVRADKNLSGGMVVEKHSQNLLIDGFYASNNSFDGFAGYETHDSTFKNMHLTQNTMSGISIDFEFDHNTFDRVVLKNNGDNGVFSHSVSNTYKQMIVSQNKNYGIYIDGRREKLEDGSWKIIPKNCDNQKFETIRMVNNKNAGLRINSACKDAVIENVAIKTGNAKTPCISLWPDATAQYLGKNVCLQK